MLSLLLVSLDEAFIATQKLLERERAELESQARQSSALSAHADEELAKHIHSLAPPVSFKAIGTIHFFICVNMLY